MLKGMFVRSGFMLLSGVAMLWLAGCGSAPTAEQLHGARGALAPSNYYVIKPGDTLFGISWRYGLDMQELANWNNISNPDVILAGSRLRMKPPSGVARVSVAAPTVSSAGQGGWIWPTRGKVVTAYDGKTPGRQGLKIGGTRGQAIVAARDGEVVYSGTGLSGYGRMVILRHGGNVLSAYGYLATAQVQEKQMVQKGQQIATMGISPQNIAALHFETRKQGQPVNPYGFIGTTPRY